MRKWGESLLSRKQKVAVTVVPKISIRANARRRRKNVVVCVDQPKVSSDVVDVELPSTVQRNARSLIMNITLVIVVQSVNLRN